MRLKFMLVGLAAATPALSAEPAFAPGKWEHATKMLSAEVPGVPQWVIKLVAGNSTRKSCDGPEIATHPEKLLTQDDGAVCKVRRISMAGGKLAFDTFCTNKRFPDGLLIASTGTYTPTSYAITTNSTGTKDGKPVKIVTTGTGTRTAPTCKK